MTIVHLQVVQDSLDRRVPRDRKELQAAQVDPVPLDRKVIRDRKVPLDSLVYATPVLQDHPDLLVARGLTDHRELPVAQECLERRVQLATWVLYVSLYVHLYL